MKALTTEHTESTEPRQGSNAEDAEDAEKVTKKNGRGVGVYASPMRPHPRIRKTLKWGGLTLVAAIMVLYVLTAGKIWSWRKVSTTHYTLVKVWHGRIEVRSSQNLGSSPRPAVPVEFVSVPLRTRTLAWGFDTWHFGKDVTFTVPFWAPALAALIASGFAWRLDTVAARRLKLGACPKCSYDRTGLAPSSPCPECGSAAPGGQRH